MGSIEYSVYRSEYECLMVLNRKHAACERASLTLDWGAMGCRPNTRKEIVRCTAHVCTLNGQSSHAILEAATVEAHRLAVIRAVGLGKAAWWQSGERDSKLSSSLPHRCPCWAKVLCATLNSVVGVQTVPHLSPLSSACRCASTSCRSSSHCVSWLSESSTSVLSTFASSEHSLSPRSVTRCMSSRHRGQLSVAVEAVANSSRSDLVFTKALLSCVPCPQETARASRLVLASSIPRSDCPRSDVYRLHSSTSRSARPGARHHSSRTYATRPVPSWPPQPSLSTRWTNCEQSRQMHC